MTRKTWIGSAFVLSVCLVSVAGAKITPVQKCEVTKLQAAGKKATGELACYAKAVKKGIPIDPACIAKVEAKFADAFAKAELKAKSDCPTLGDASTAEDLVDTLVTGMGQLEHVCVGVNQICEIAPCCPGSGTCGPGPIPVVFTCN